MFLRALELTLHQQFAIEHAVAVEALRDFGKGAGDVVAGAAVEPGLAADADELDADPVPFPLSGEFVERDARIFERMGEHERPEDRHVLCLRLLAPPLRPGEERQIGRPDTVPHLLDRIDVEPEGLCQCRLGEAGRNADAQLAGRELQQGVAAAGVEMVEHLRQRRRRFRAAETLQPLDDRRDAQAAVVDLRRLLDPLRPEQRDRLGHVADIVPAHIEEHRIDPLLDDRADRRRFDAGQVELAGQRRHRPAAVRIGRTAEIIADQLQLAVARARVDEGVEQLGEIAHRLRNDPVPAGFRRGL